MLPSEIRSKSLRRTYYTVQGIIAERYERALRATADKETRRRLTEQFHQDIRDTISYYVNLCESDNAHIRDML